MRVDLNFIYIHFYSRRIAGKFVIYNFHSMTRNITRFVIIDISH